MNRLTWVLTCGLLIVPVGNAFADVGSELRMLTGKHTRVVWGYSTGQTDGYSIAIYGIDSDDGKGPRAIVPQGTNKYRFALITPSGSQVVYSRFKGGYPGPSEIWVVNWDGTNNKKLKDNGAACCVWQDPKTKSEWIYYIPQFTGHQAPTRRFLLDSPSTDEVVLSSTQISHGWFSLSADGTWGGGASPLYGYTGVINMSTGKFTQYGIGCWASIAPDNSYRLLESHEFSHETIAIYDFGNKNKRQFSSPYAKGASSVTACRWVYTTTGAQYITIMSPEKPRDKTEIIFMKFNADVTKLEDWVRVTHTGKNLSPHAWVSSEEAAADTVATPIIHPHGGQYADSVEVTIACSTAGATIRYTISGTTPVTTSSKYTKPIVLTKDATLKAIGFKSGMVESPLATATFTITTASVYVNIGSDTRLFSWTSIGKDSKTFTVFLPFQDPYRLEVFEIKGKSVEIRKDMRLGRYQFSHESKKSRFMIVKATTANGIFAKRVVILR